MAADLGLDATRLPKLLDISGDVDRLDLFQCELAAFW